MKFRKLITMIQNDLANKGINHSKKPAGLFRKGLRLAFR